jgi:hypothetical protein
MGNLICTFGFGNTGTARTKSQTVLKKLFFGQYYDETGAVNTLFYAPTGTVATAGSTITGTGTNFTRLKAGDPIQITGEVRVIIGTIVSDTSITGCTTVSGATVVFAGVTGATWNVLNAAFFTSFINHKNAARRMYPTTQIKNATNKRGASIGKGYDDGTTIIVQQGIRKIDFIIVGADATPQFANLLNTAKTVDCGFWGYDKDGNIWGMKNIAGQLDQWRIDQNTFDAIYNPGDDKDTATITVTFDILTTEADANINSINACDMATDVNTNIFKGLLDVTATISGITTAGFVMELTTVYGSAPKPYHINGVVKTDFYSNVTPFAAGDIYRTNNTPAAVVITSVTERKDATSGQPTGIYDVVVPTATSADTLDLNIIKDNGDFSTVNVVVITIP